MKANLVVGEFCSAAGNSGRWRQSLADRFLIFIMTGLPIKISRDSRSIDERQSNHPFEEKLRRIDATVN
jgi:hypothetical protein